MALSLKTSAALVGAEDAITMISNGVRSACRAEYRGAVVSRAMRLIREGLTVEQVAERLAAESGFVPAAAAQPVKK